MIKIVTGNLLDAKEDVICHQVNCQGVMGAGVAKAIRDRWPEVHRDYRRYVEDHIWKKESPLGTVQYVPIEYGRFVANLFAQECYGNIGRYTSYDAFYKCLCDIAYHIADDVSIAFPYGIGCGLGGGSWHIVYAMIEDVLGDWNVVIYKLEDT